ncbi:MAG: endolytic transglycosylase MltG, partial [Thermoleophilia bacterium]|nr:endolytic transglycosylase MltG [Thermoleophilia bacterium]
IKEGSSLKGIAAELEAKGVVKHARAFVIRADADGYATRFMPGTYTFRVNEPYDVLVAGLLTGVRPPTITVSIPEGTTLEQAAVIVSDEVKGISTAGYVKVARDDPPPFRLQGYKKGTTLEGMLFPATYEVSQKANARSMVRSQLDAFEKNFSAVDMSRAAAANLTGYDVVIIASMIDREAQVAAERPVVAAVIWNRLRVDMLLQIDATIQYALGETKPMLTYDDLEIDSPYNTYKYPGLPPTPISNPGLAALKAAADPSDDKYLYYVARNDGTGRHYFSTTYEEFLADKAKAAANDQ